MTNDRRAVLDDLIARFERVDRPSRELNGAIAQCFGWSYDSNAGHWWAPDPDSRPLTPARIAANLPFPTSLIDDMLTLIGPEWLWTIYQHDGVRLTHRTRTNPKDGFPLIIRGKGCTPAISGCIAALRSVLVGEAAKPRKPSE